MRTRTLEYFAALARIAHLVEHHPTLRDRAAESTAFDLFKGVIAEFETALTDETRNRVEREELAARVNALKNAVLIALESVAATQDVVPPYRVVLPKLRLPKPNAHPARFEQEASGLLDHAERHLALFVEMGLHPHRIDDGRRLLTELARAEQDLMMVELYIAAFRGRVADLTTRARKRVRQLRADLGAAVDDSLRADWRRAASLGRTHRSNAIAPAPALGQIPARTGDPREADDDPLQCSLPDASSHDGTPPEPLNPSPAA